MNSKFNAVQEKLVLKACNVAAQYLLSKYGSARLLGEPKVELTSQSNAQSGYPEFSGTITVSAGVEGYDNLNVNLVVHDNNLEVESESTMQDNIENALNAAAEYLPTDEVIHASLDSFKLTEDGSKYLKVAHPAFGGGNIGVVGINEYNASSDKAELLKNIVSDAISRTASYNYDIQFTGSFVEPKIEKKADFIDEKFCPECGHEDELMPSGLCAACTADLEHDAICDYTCPEHGINAPKVSEQTDLPLARMTGGVEAASQLEAQKIEASKVRLSDKVASELHTHLYKLGYSAKVQELNSDAIVASENGLEGQIDAIALVDDHGVNKIVAMPIKVKASTIELPKRPLVQELVNKAIDINQRLSEELAKEAISKMAAIDEKVAYEANEVESILSEGLKKTAAEDGLSGTQYMPDQCTMTLQKHLLPGDLAKTMEIGDQLFADGQTWKLVSKESKQLDKNEDSGSIWKFVVCDPEDKEPEVKVKI